MNRRLVIGVSAVAAMGAAVPVIDSRCQIATCQAIHDEESGDGAAVGTYVQGPGGSIVAYGTA